MDDNGFDITVEQDESSALVSVAGELDLVSAPTLREAVEAIEAPQVVLDLSGVEFMNSSGLSVLIVLSKRLRGRGGDLVIRGARPMLAKTFTIAGVDEMLHVESAPED
jgi:anti-sigma B factor antagonist